MQQTRPPSCGLAAGGLLNVGSRRYNRCGASGYVQLRARRGGERYRRKQRIRACDIGASWRICLDIGRRGQPLRLRLSPNASLFSRHSHRGRFGPAQLLRLHAFWWPPAAFHRKRRRRIVIDHRFVGLLKARLLRQWCVPPQNQDSSNHDHVPERRFRQSPPGCGGLDEDVGPEGRGLRGYRHAAHDSE